MHRNSKNATKLQQIFDINKLKFKNMSKPKEIHIFKPIEGVWRDVAGDSANILANFLDSLELQIDDRTQFARIYDYQRGIAIWYRASALKITITIWQIDNN